MYSELLDIVRGAEDPDDTETGSASTDVTEYRAADNYAANMPIVAEESETEYPSFSVKKRHPPTSAVVR